MQKSSAAPLSDPSLNLSAIFSRFLRHFGHALGACGILGVLLFQGAAPAFAEDALETSSAAPATPPPGSTQPVATPGAIDNRPVTMQQFKELVRAYKGAVDRVGTLEGQVRQMSSQGANGKDGAVDLSQMSSSPGAPTSTSTAVNTGQPATPASGNFHGQGSSSTPDFKVYFDLDFISRPGIENLSFDNYHSFLFFEVSPLPTLQFSFDVNPSPRYYELDYQATRWLQLRAGKIWIPFDDMSPHNIFGGRVNVSRLTAETGAPAFLPDLWTDLGVGFKINLVDKPKLTVEVYGYVVNGFPEGGKDPVTPNSPYPNFADIPTGPDNNRDKALGGRIHALIFRQLGLGFSYYNCRWTNDTGTEVANGDDPQRLSILGFDAQIRIKSTEFRTGLATMAVNLPTGDTANRGGLYFELGQKFGRENDWKVLGRFGKTQLDDRVTDTNAAVPLGDEEIVGGTLLWKPGLVQYSIEYNQDLEQSPAKVNHSYAAARIVMAF